MLSVDAYVALDGMMKNFMIWWCENWSLLLFVCLHARSLWSINKFHALTTCFVVF